MTARTDGATGGASAEGTHAGGQAGDDRIELRISDNGPGLPPGFDLAASKSLGLRITSLLVDELEGELGLDRPEGGTGLVAMVRLGRGILAE